MEASNAPKETTVTNSVRSKTKKKYQPLANRRNQNKPTKWAELQKNWPQKLLGQQFIRIESKCSPGRGKGGRQIVNGRDMKSIGK